eukprot:SAG31_NODE_92_length_26360_cov_29.601881_18_plen_193_part_00
MFEYRPIEYVVIYVTFTHEQVSEKLATVRIVRFFVESKAAAVVQICRELRGKAFAQNLNGGGVLFVTDFIVFLALCLRFQALPREGTTQKVKQNVAHRFHIVSAGLFNAQMCVETSVAGRACKIFMLPVRNVLMGTRVSVFLRQTKIDHVNLDNEECLAPIDASSAAFYKMALTWFARLPRPMRKLSGLISR